MSQNYNSDTELLASVAEGSSSAIDQLYQLYHSMLIKWICNKGGSEEDAEDAFQNAVMVLYEKAQDPEFCLTCKLSTYFFAVCKRIWLKKKALYKATITLEQEDNEESILIAEEDKDVQVFLLQEERFQQMSRALKLLGEPCAGLIKAFYVEQKSMQEIAQLYHYTNPANAKNQKYKCLNRLRKLFFAESVINKK